MNDQKKDDHNAPSELRDFETLFKANYTKLCLISYRITGDKACAEDIVQDIFFKFWSDREKISIRSTVNGYLYQSVVNASINYSKKTQKFSPIENLSDYPQEDHRSENVNELELREKVKQAIDNLPPKCRAIFILSKYEGLKYQEIASLLNISVKTVENQMSIALEKLRNTLKGYFQNTFNK
jgi:RNA polymerase sigma-70 factor (ECF subfamily)